MSYETEIGFCRGTNTEATQISIGFLKKLEELESGIREMKNSESAQPQF